MLMRVAIRRIRCRECGASCRKAISFCPNPYVRYTKWAARWGLRLRPKMSIKAVAKFAGLHRETVTHIEKKWLQKKYRTVHLGEVEYLGIDEVCLGKKLGYITVVRDMDSVAMLFVGRGKKGDALKVFRTRLKRRAKHIKAVAIDMVNSYSDWVKEVLSDADIVYDHFHVIKLMNKRMNNPRKITMNKLEDVHKKKELKGKRVLLLRNEESLSVSAADDLKKIRFKFKDLGTASMMIKYLRNIYKLADSYELARTAFLLWSEKFEVSDILCLKQMAKTIRRRLDGLLAYCEC